MPGVAFSADSKKPVGHRVRNDGTTEYHVILVQLLRCYSRRHVTFAPGTRLGSNEIIAKLGEGGMGEVYRATDVRLKRHVAIKLLPAAFTADKDRLVRFEREAQLLASLNHPNIAHVYGFESATLPDGSAGHFLSMELVEGEDLAERLKRGAIPVEEAVAIARQIADALEEAHERGIVHRDLKPANVKVTPDGKVKVLDFGLAKALALEGASATAEASGPSTSPTFTTPAMTQAGMIMGTAAYMSPEQARGKAVDKRSDIWAFGVVLFEMLTGQRVFQGETVSDIMAATLRQEIDWNALPPTTPANVRQLLRRCLERDPKRRLRDIGEARFALDEGSSVEAGPYRAPGRRSAAFRLGALALVAIASAAAGIWLWTTLRTDTDARCDPLVNSAASRTCALRTCRSGDLTRWTSHRVRRTRRVGRLAAVFARARSLRCERGCRQRRRSTTLLLAGRPPCRLLRACEAV